MDNQRPCACCGQPFEVNPRARSRHVFCRETACQGERRRRSQQLRRAKQRRARERRADYMRSYRASRPDYRRREAERAATRRARRMRRAEAEDPEKPPDESAKAASPGVGPWRAFVEVVGGPDGPEVRVVTEAGFTLRLAAAVG